MLKVKITRRQNEPVTKTVQIDDPKTGSKQMVSYQTYEWKDKYTTDVISLPKNSQTLKMLSEVASAAGYNDKVKTLDYNIRYIVEVVESTDESVEDGGKQEYWFRSTCGNVVFENQAKQRVGNTIEYRCPYCSELLAFKQ